MALKPVSDPSILAQLSAPEARQPVSDPALLAQLNGTELPLDEQVPIAGQPPAVTKQEETGFFENLFNEVKSDPILQMWGSGLKTILQGAPETALTVGNNAAVQGVAGLTAPFVAENDDDAADFVRDFTEQHSYSPRGESARQLTQGLGDALQPAENVKQGLGDTILEATGSPGLATAGYMAPDLATILLGPKPSAGVYGTMRGPAGQITTKTKAPKADLTAPGSDLSGGAPPLEKRPRVDPNDPVGSARAAGYKVLPSDVERVTGKKPGLGDRIAEALAPDDVRREMVIENQGATNRLAREKAKAPEGTRMDRRNIKEQKQPHIATYREVEEAVNIVPPSEDYLFALDAAKQRAAFKPGTSPSVLDTISALRKAAKRKQNNAQADQKIINDGQLDEQAADSLEEALGVELSNTGQAELLTKYQEARKSLAELNDIDMTQRAGNVDAGKLYARDRKTPDRMTGQTKLAADVAENFPDATRSSMSAAGRKKAGGDINKEGMLKKGAKKAARGVAKVVGLGDRLLVESEGFQNRLGPTATPAERSYFSEYGKPPVKGAPAAAAPAGEIPKTNVMPPQKGGLGDELQLLDDVENPDVLPEAPDRLTADVVPRARGDIEPDFDVQAEADKLAGELGLDIRTGTKGAVGEKELAGLIAKQRSDGLEVAPPREMEQMEFSPPTSAEQATKLKLTRSDSPKEPKVQVESGDVGDHYFTSDDGAAVAQENGEYLQMKRIDVDETARRGGQGMAMMKAALKKADKLGQRLASDVSVSEAQVGVWRKFAKAVGRKLRENPATKSSKGSLVSKDPRKPVFEFIDDAVAE